MIRNVLYLSLPGTSIKALPSPLVAPPMRMLEGVEVPSAPFQVGSILAKLS
jgi:hypothetical protein